MAIVGSQGCAISGISTPAGNGLKTSAPALYLFVLTCYQSKLDDKMNDKIRPSNSIYYLDRLAHSIILLGLHLQLRLRLRPRKNSRTSGRSPAVRRTALGHRQNINCVGGGGVYTYFNALPDRFLLKFINSSFTLKVMSSQSVM